MECNEDMAYTTRQRLQASVQVLTIFVLIATTILSFKLYTQVEVMTQGGPENATATVVWYIVHQSIHNVRVGYASAIAVIFFLILLIRVIPILRSVNVTGEREL